MSSPTSLPELIAALKKTCTDYKLDWSQGHEENAVVESIIDHIDEQEDQAEAAGLLA